MRTSLVTAGAAILFALAAGCAGYRVGPVNGVAPQGKAVTVNLFENKTFEPRLSESVAFALRKKLQRDGTFQLETREDGDIVLNGTILEFLRSPLSFEPTDILTPRDYNISVLADVTATERATGKVVLKQQFSGQTSVRAVGNRDVAERQAQPLLAEDLARNITAALTEGPW